MLHSQSTVRYFNRIVLSGNGCKNPEERNSLNIYVRRKYATENQFISVLIQYSWMKLVKFTFNLKYGYSAKNNRRIKW